MALFSTLIAQIGLPFLIDLVSSSLKKSDNETLQKVGDVLIEEVSQIDEETLATTSLDHLKIQELELRLEQEKILQVNETYRSEVASNDSYVRRMRPTFGYIMALTWAAQMLAIAYVVITQPSQASYVIEAFGALSMIWSVGLSVLGVYVYNRSQEKKKDQGSQSMIDQIGRVFVKDINKP